MRHKIFYQTALRVALGAALLSLNAGVITGRAQSVSFEDMSDSAGLTTAGPSNGISVHDFDGDGWDDIFIATSKGPSKLFRNRGDATFEDVTEAAGLSTIGAATVALWGDVDADGIADLFVAADGGNRLFRNRGDAAFEDITGISGIDTFAVPATAAFGDVDGDGALDLFLAVDRGPDILYRNTLDRVIFVDASAQAGIAGSSHVVPMQVTWVDYDYDNDLDLFCVHDGKDRSRLYRNAGFLPLIDIASTSRIDRYPDASVCCNMGTAWGDFDGDGFQDGYVTRIGRGGLFRNNGDGTFDDVAAERGVDRNGMSWGVVFADLDNDADLDLFIVSTSGYDQTPTLLYRNDGGMFTEIGRQAGASFLLDAKGLASGDFNNDGLIDLVIAASDGRNRLLLNTSTETGHWVKVDLKRASRSPIGARIEISAGGKTHVRSVSGGDSYASQSSSTLHVGLDTADQIESLRVYWGGALAQEERDLGVDAFHTVLENIQTNSLEPPEPSLFRLEGNFPNPFEASTTIRYVISEPGPVWMEVFDALGRRMAIIVDGFKPAGAHEATFEAGRLESGPYFYRLHEGGRTTSRQMVLVK